MSPEPTEPDEPKPKDKDEDENIDVVNPTEDDDDSKSFEKFCTLCLWMSKRSLLDISVMFFVCYLF